MPLNKKDLKRNIAYAFCAQGISLVLSVMMTLIVPKILGVEAFSYWQLFVFYTSYGGFLHFGLYDGIYLRLGGSRYASLDKECLGWQLKASLIWQSAICLLVSIASSLIFEGDRFYVVICSCLCTLVSNAIFFFGYILQAVNNIKHYSISLMIERTLFICSIVVTLLVGEQGFRTLIVLYICCRTVALVYNSIQCTEIVKAISKRVKANWGELKENIKCGLTLTFSNISSMLILGTGRFLIDANFGIIEFGKISFAIVMTNFFLVFMNQVSMVMFPALRRLNGDELGKSFTKLNYLLSAFTPIILLLYLPISVFIDFWLPDYSDSLFYLIFLLPLCCYDGKMQMLNNTFLKVLREEKKLLLFNVVACAVSATLTVVAIYAFHSITLVVLSMLFSLCLRSSLAEAFLSRKYNLNVTKDMVLFIFMTIAFILLNVFCRPVVASVAFICLYGLYLLHYKNCISLVKAIIKR